MYANSKMQIIVTVSHVAQKYNQSEFRYTTNQSSDIQPIRAQIYNQSDLRYTTNQS